MSVEARPDEICSGLGTLAEASQKEDAAIVESPAGVMPPPLCQAVRLRAPADSRSEDLTGGLCTITPTGKEVVL